MKIDFDTISEHIIPMDNSPMKWYFNGKYNDKLPEIHLNQLRQLNKEASKFLWDYISATRLHSDIPFKKGFFRHIDKARSFVGNEKDIKKWLYQRGIAFDKDVYLSWQPDSAMIVPWKLVIKYFDDFGWQDITVIDRSLTWALLFYHENEIYFGTNKDFVPSEAFADIDFLW